MLWEDYVGPGLAGRAANMLWPNDGYQADYPGTNQHGTFCGTAWQKEVRFQTPFGRIDLIDFSMAIPLNQPA